MLSIKEASEQVSITPSSIRYYDEQGLLPFVKRDVNGYRQFQEGDLLWLEMIGCMRSTGMSIETLRHIAHLHMEGEPTLEERKNIFKDHQRKLFKEKEDIDDALDKLAKKMEILEHSSSELGL